VGWGGFFFFLGVGFFLGVEGVGGGGCFLCVG